MDFSLVSCLYSFTLLSQKLAHDDFFKQSANNFYSCGHAETQTCNFFSNRRNHLIQEIVFHFEIKTHFWEYNNYFPKTSARLFENVFKTSIQINCFAFFESCL